MEDSDNKYDASVDIQIGQKYESAGLFEQAIDWYKKAKIDAHNSKDTTAWQIAAGVRDVNLSEKDIKKEYDRRKRNCDEWTKKADEGLERIKNKGFIDTRPPVDAGW